MEIVDASTTLESINDEPHIYLLPEYDFPEDQEELIAHFHPIVFEYELNGWWTDRRDWPEGRDLTMFRAWFDVSFHSMITDLRVSKKLKEL